MRVPIGLLVSSLVTLSTGCKDISEPQEESLAVEPSLATVGSTIGISNLAVASGKTYKVVPGGVRSEARYYVDRTYELRSPIPSALQGLTLIQTAKADRSANPGSSDFITFDIDQDAAVYVAHDPGLTPPRWLAENFQKTGSVLLTSDYGGRLNVFRRVFSKGRVRLGSNLQTSGTGRAMYAVAVGPAVGGSSPSPSPTPPSGNHAGWQVATNGSSGGQGSQASPWSLTHALSGAGGKIQPGDTVWLRGGKYAVGDITATLRGTAAAPVIVRQWPGERATIDGSVNVTGGGYVWYWGMEVTQSNLGWRNLMCWNVLAPGVRIINQTVHDCSGNGIGLWVEAPNSEATGNLVYNNGRAGAAAGRYAHGIYFQNASGSKLLKQNVVLNSYSHNFHGWAGETAHRNYTIEENVSINAGSFMSYGGREYLVGGGVPVENLQFRRNQAHRVGDVAQTDVGYYEGASNPSGSVVADNYLTGSLRVYRFAGLTVTGNTVVGTGSDGGNPIALIRNKGSGPWNWNNNNYWGGAGFAVWALSYLTKDFLGWRLLTGFDGSSSFSSGKPTNQRVTVLKNSYEPGRAFVVVWNWSNAASASVDLSGVLPSGKAYEVRDAQRVWDAPVAQGTYGGPVSLPMRSVTPYAPTGATDRPAASTGTLLHVFLVVSK